MKTIEISEKCKSCEGTGLYIGMAERDGAAIVCHTCKGTGCHHFVHKYEDFVERIPKINVTRVFECNPGIILGTKGGEFSLGYFGGMPYEDWEAGREFSAGMENRRFTCPAWWYQSVNYALKPNWDKCGGGIFPGCEHFNEKEDCWRQWDDENE